MVEGFLISKALAERKSGNEIEEVYMSNGFGIFEGAVSVVMCMWFIHVGFMVKRLLKESLETNRVLRQMAPKVQA
jgi:hypothetical protein